MANRPIPHYINENQSDMRGIKDGWYAMEEVGNLVAGPFSSREECLKLFNPIIAQEAQMLTLRFGQTQSSVDDCDQTPALRKLMARYL
jgi:hypothetical protein